MSDNEIRAEIAELLAPIDAIIESSWALLDRVSSMVNLLSQDLDSTLTEAK